MIFKEEVHSEEIIDLSIDGEVIEEGTCEGRSPVGSREIPRLEDLPEGAEFITDDGFSTPEEPGIRLKAVTGYHFIIDARDWDLIKDYKWYVRSNGRNTLYVSAYSNYTTLYLHRLITGARSGEVVDHRFGTTLDNRSYNLRIATYSQNNQNRRKKNHYKGRPCHSNFKGVTYMKAHGKKKWRARIQVNGEDMSLGYYRHPMEAAMAYDDAAREHFGEFCKTNF